MGGVLAALGAAFGFAVFQTVQRRALRGIDVLRGTAAVLVVAATVLAVLTGLRSGFGAVLAAPALALLAAAAAGLVHFGLGWTLLAVSQVRLGAARTGIVVGTVPLFGALVAAFVLDESLSAVSWLGLVVTVLGVGVVVGRPRRHQSAGGTTGVDDVGAVRSARLGVLAGLGTAACWSVSPVLIRYSLRSLPSPLAAATVGMSVCAAAYVAALFLTGRLAGTVRDRPPGAALLLVSGTAVGLAILLQWTAFDRAPIAVVLAVLQLTPPLVVALATRVAGDVAPPGARRRTWAGAALTLAGSLVLVLVG